MPAAPASPRRRFTSHTASSCSGSPDERLTDMPGDVEQDLTVLINPVIEPVGSERALGWEGCLSVPGLRGVVPRHLRIRYRGSAPTGKPSSARPPGFHARVVQHECDHLDGILYPQRMTDHRLLMFIEELQRHPIDLAAILAAAEPDEEPVRRAIERAG